MNVFNILPPEKQAKLKQAFGRDAAKAITALREALVTGDVTALTATFHSMKSALGNIGEEESSNVAKSLETAGKNGDIEYIVANVDAFIKTLERLSPSEAAPESESSDEEDYAFVREQMNLVKSACENYDIKTAYSALDALLSTGFHKPLSGKTQKFTKEMRDLLYLDSNFDGVTERVAEFLSKYRYV